MVMEYIDGEDLEKRRERNRGCLPEVEALRYIQQIGNALIVVHNQGLLHRDVKPQNIMLRSGTSEAVLIDFGIAREFTPNLTQTHTKFVSDSFAPIEQYYDQAKRGAYTDVYALAATLYVLLTGKLPVSATARAANAPLVSPKQINPSISDVVNRAILQGMEFEAKNRPQSIQEWLRLLKSKRTLDSSNLEEQTSMLFILIGNIVFLLTSMALLLLFLKAINFHFKFFLFSYF
jgi:serine/threonine protein kinase